MDSALSQLTALAGGAVVHACQSHAVSLSYGDFDCAEAILQSELKSVGGTDREALAAFYGAWLGCWAIAELGAHWTGLHEPYAPRLKVGGVTCSPIDAIERYLSQVKQSPGIRELAKQMTDWKKETIQHSVASSVNHLAWNELANDMRFAGAIPLPPDQASAIAALDPWISADWVPGCRLLCLGAGGGRQGPLHAIAGAVVTVVDISEKQLDHDRRIAADRGLLLQCLCGNAERLDHLRDESFDVVVQPVSTCYLKDVHRMYAEIARVLRPGGLYVVQHKHPSSLLATGTSRDDYRIATPMIDGRPLPALSEDLAQQTPQRERDMIEYPHSMDTLIGGLCNAGFIIAGFSEPPRADAFATHESLEFQACFLPPYFRLKAIRKESLTEN